MSTYDEMSLDLKRKRSGIKTGQQKICISLPWKLARVFDEDNPLTRDQK